MMDSLTVERLHKAAEQLCHRRNQNTSVDVGKTLYEPCEQGVVFLHAHFLLDSMHSDYTQPVAKVVRLQESPQWQILCVFSRGQLLQWAQYPFFAPTDDLAAVLAEIEHDKHNFFWK